jgi:hypothetical protein
LKSEAFRSLIPGVVFTNFFVKHVSAALHAVVTLIFILHVVSIQIFEKSSSIDYDFRCKAIELCGHFLPLLGRPEYFPLLAIYFYTKLNIFDLFIYL